MFFQRPFAEPATRTSFQDSNIFGNKRNDSPTVQQSARDRDMGLIKDLNLNRTLNHSKTYKSSILVYKEEEPQETPYYNRKQQAKET